MSDCTRLRRWRVSLDRGDIVMVRWTEYRGESKRSAVIRLPRHNCTVLETARRCRLYISRLNSLARSETAVIAG